MRSNKYIKVYLLNLLGPYISLLISALFLIIFITSPRIIKIWDLDEAKCVIQKEIKYTITLLLNYILSPGKKKQTK